MADQVTLIVALESWGNQNAFWHSGSDSKRLLNKKIENMFMARETPPPLLAKVIKNNHYFWRASL